MCATAVKPEVVAPPTYVGVGYGGDLMMTCIVASYPAINEIAWYRNGHEVITSASAVIMMNATAVTSRLTITNVTEAACGNYSFFSANSQMAMLTGRICYRNEFVLITVLRFLSGEQGFPRYK